MDCVSCPMSQTCHDSTLSDVTIMKCIVHSIEHGHTGLALGEAELFLKRLEKRHNEVTGRTVV